jgi:hypothetical protein
MTMQVQAALNKTDITVVTDRSDYGGEEIKACNEVGIKTW